MNTYQEAEDALLAVSAMQRTILDAGIAMCYSALDNTGDTAMTSYSVHTKHGLYCVYTLEQLRRDNPTDIDVEDMDAAIEADGWCGTYIDVEPVVVIDGEDHQHGLPIEADAYLAQGASSSYTTSSRRMSMTDKQWWAVVTNRRVGPYETRQAAYDAFRAKYPLSEPKRIATGYGSNSAWFDIRWGNPNETETPT